MPPIAYQYGLLPPHVGADVVDRQMTLNHRYHNQLIEIERRRRRRAREALLSSPAVAEADRLLTEAVAARDAARDQIKVARSAARGRAETADARATAKNLAAEVARLTKVAKEAKRSAAQDAEIRMKLDAIDQMAKDEHKAARKASGVYWGTYLLTESAMRAARGQSGMPEFRRRRRGGLLGVQIQGGIPQEELWGGDSRVVITRPSDDAWSQGVRRCDRRRAARTVLRMRVSSERGRPIWAEWRMIMHRPLPPGRIKAITIVAVPRNCWQMSWTVSILVDAPEGFGRKNRPDSGRVALNLGFHRKEDGSIRAGYVVGDDGHHEEIVVPFSRDRARGVHGVIDALEKSASIRGFRDKWLDQMKEKLGAWYAPIRERFAKVRDRIAAERDQERAGPNHWILAEAWKRIAMYSSSPDAPLLPDWIASRIAHVHAWRSPAAARQLYFRWRDNRFQDDEPAFAIMEEWRKREDHLECYESGMRRRALLARREIFRLAAARLSARYRELVVDDTDLRDLVKKPRPEEEARGFQRRNQTIAAGSSLRDTFKMAFGTEAVAVKAAHLTVRCHACKAENDIARESGERMHTCTACAVTWDIDYNFCCNALAAPVERPEAKPAKATATERMRAARTKRPAADAQPVAD